MSQPKAQSGQRAAWGEGQHWCKELQLGHGDPHSPHSGHGSGSGGQYKGLEGTHVKHPTPLAQPSPSHSGAGGCRVLIG